MLAGACGLAVAMPAQAQLDQALRIAKGSTAAAAASQQRIDDLDDAADTAVRDYRAILQQIDNMKLFVDQQQIYLDGQKEEIKSLKKQLNSVDAVKRGMVPMMFRMAAEIEDSVNSDMPFKLRERRARLDRMKAALADPGISPTEQYRQVLSVYKNEVAYGQGLSSYEGPHPKKAGNKVDYLMVGRMALIYLSKDEKDLGYYDLATKTWKPLDKSWVERLRQAIRVAKGQGQPTMVLAPVHGVEK